MRPAAAVGLAVTPDALLIMVGLCQLALGVYLGAHLERRRHREVSPCERHRWDTERTELVDLTIDLRHQLTDAQAEIAAYREAFPMAALAIDQQRSVN